MSGYKISVSSSEQSSLIGRREHSNQQLSLEEVQEFIDILNTSFLRNSLLNRYQNAVTCSNQQGQQ